MSESPAWSAATLRSSLSTQMTSWPISAKQTAATRPTYPDPTTAILMFSLIVLWCYSSQLRITERRNDREDLKIIGYSFETGAQACSSNLSPRRHTRVD